MSLDPHAFSILVVDDEKVARLALTRMLLKCGYTGTLVWENLNVLDVKSVGSAREALDYMQTQAKPHLILCDVKMPDITGIDFLHMLFAEPEYANIPVISMSFLL